MARGNINTFGMIRDIHTIIEWLECNVTRLDDSSKIMKKTLGELESSEFFQCEQSLYRLREELCEILIPCFDRIEHAKYVMDNALTHYKGLEEIINDHLK